MRCHRETQTMMTMKTRTRTPNQTTTSSPRSSENPTNSSARVLTFVRGAGARILDPAGSHRPLPGDRAHTIEPVTPAARSGRPRLPVPLLQRVMLNGQHSTYVVLGSRIGTSSLGKGALFRAPSMQQPRQAVISFDAARLVIDSVLLVTLPGELLLGGPWPRPHGRIFHHDLVFEGLWSGARPALDEVQVLARPLEIGFRTEVGHVD